MSSFLIPSATYLHSATTYLQSTFSNAQTKSQALLNNLSERVHFLREFIKDPFINGSIIPSSPQLTERITHLIPPLNHKNQNRYLEAGAGTGIFTEAIIKRMSFADQLDVIELNPSYCERLKSKFGHLPNVHIHCCSITEWNPDDKYDAVISGLPLNCFPLELATQCLDTFKRITKDGGILSYFDYPMPAKIWSKILFFGENGRTLRKILEIKEEFFKTYGFKVEKVKENFPAANVYHFKMSEKQDAPAQTV